MHCRCAGERVGKKKKHMFPKWGSPDVVCKLINYPRLLNVFNHKNAAKRIFKNV